MGHPAFEGYQSVNWTETSRVQGGFEIRYFYAVSSRLGRRFLAAKFFVFAFGASHAGAT